MVAAHSCSLSLLASLMTGCGSASTTMVSPSPLAARCGVALGSSSTSFAASGGTGTLTVQAARECTWTITERPAWISVTPARETQGALEVSFAVEPNRSTASRSGDVVIADQRTRISREAATCPWTITPSQASLGASGGDVRARLITEDFCSWEAASPARWIAVSPQSGKGSADITLEVVANTGDKRSGKMRVGGVVVEVEQRSAPAAPLVPPAPPRSPQAPAPPQEPEANSPPPVSNPPQIPAPPQPTPPAPTFPPQVPAPPVVIPPQPTPLPQTPVPPVIPPPKTPAPPVVIPPPPSLPPASAACSYAVTPQRFELSRKSRDVDISVVTQPSCRLQAATNAGWLEISTNTRTGTGKLRLEVGENQGASRTGEVTLTGDGFKTTVVVLQQGKKRDDDDDDD